MTASLISALVLGAAAASPQEPVGEAPADPNYYMAQPAYAQYDPLAPHLVTRIGLGFLIGGGVTQYFAPEATRLVHLGPAWAARMVIGTRSYIASEFAYIGSSQRVQGFSSDTQQIANGVEGLLRVNFATGIVQPYIAAGVGWKHYSVFSPVLATSDFSSRTDVGLAPVAAGLDVRLLGLIIDTRVGVAIPFTIPALNGLPMMAAGTTWDASINVGWEF